jgi:hypothetical protein
MSEHDNQVAVFQWAKLREGQYPALKMMFAVPNAGKRSPGAAAYYLAEGLKSGVPDIILPVAYQYPYNGLVIEMKDGKNKPTPNQKTWLERFDQAGWRDEVCYSAKEAITVIKDFLKIHEDDQI